MKVETLDWIDKAEGDWKVAKREIQAPDPVWNVICFLAQQCAEKYVKAFLEEHNVRFRRIHDLVVLVDSTKGLLPELESYKRKLAELSVFGLAARYPGTKANRQSADDSIKTAEHVRTVVRTKLGLVSGTGN